MDMTATSVVPPPMSTTILPRISPIGRPAPSAAAIGSSIKKACRAPAAMTASYTARFSTSVTPVGMPTTTRGRGKGTTLCSWTLPMKYSSMICVISNSEMTPSLKGRTATTLVGVRPAISLASRPIAIGCRSRLSIVTHEGSLMTIPLPRTCTRVFAVPRSMAMSRENRPKSQFNGLKAKLGSSV